MRLFRLFLAGLVVSAVAATPSSVLAATAVRGAAWILVDEATGEVLGESNPDRRLPPASLTKMVTAQVVLERTKMDDVIRISGAASNAEADRVRWPLGMQFTVEEILHGLLMESSNGAAIALAEHIAGSQRSFAALMNEKARRLGAVSSSFVNPHGLDAAGQVATPRDLAVIARELLRLPALGAIVRAQSYKLTWQGGLTTFHNNTRFLSQYAGAIGIKPGYTTRAGNCLAAAARRGDKTIIAVVLNSTSVTEDASALMDMGFDKLGVEAGAPTANTRASQELEQAQAPVSEIDPEPAPLASPAQAVVRAPLIADSRVPSPAGTLLVFAVSGLVSVRRKKSRPRVRMRRPG